MRIEAIQRSLDAANLAVRAPAESVERHEIAEAVLQLGRPLATDTTALLAATARFVIVDDYEIAGGGLVQEALPDAQMPLREKVLLRNYKWETSFIPVEARVERYHQRPTLVLITGPREVDRKHLAKALEARLFAAGRVVYYVGMASVVYGVDADLGGAAEHRAEHVRRLAEIANLLLDAGVVLVASAAELSVEDLAHIRTAAPPDRVLTARLGGPAREGDDLHLDPGQPLEENVERLLALLANRGTFDVS
jgi:bifunctional enzyme CysN/CysC